MKKKNPKPIAVSTTGSTAQTLRPVWLYAVFAFLLVLLCAAAIHLVQVRASNQQQLEALSQQLARTHATALAQFIRDQNVYLEFLASRPAVLDALRNQDNIALRTLETEYAENYAYAGRLTIIPLSAMGTAALDFPGHLLNSIETDMVVKAVRGKQVAAEAYKQGRQSMVTLLQTVGSTPEELEGALLLSVESKAFSQIVGRASADQGRLAVLQKVGDEPLTMFEQGQASDSAPVIAVAFPDNDKWTLEFRASDQLVAATSSNSLLAWILLGSTSVTLLIAGIAVYRRLHKGLETDLTELRDYLEQLKDGERALPPAISIDQLTEIASLAFDISQLPPISGKPSKVDAEAAAELSEKMAGKKAVQVEAQDAHVEETEVASPQQPPQRELPPPAAGIFRAYDIRGVVGEDLRPDDVYQIGLAAGSEALDQGQQAVIIGRDGRLTSEELATQLSRGLQDCGVDVIDLGLVPTPVLYFATQQLNTASGIMVTGSHNPPGYNGLKLVIGGKTLAEEGITRLKQRIDDKRLHSGSGTYSTADISAQYVDYVLGDIAVAQPLKVVIDCGNGATGTIAPRLFEDLGCEVIPLYCDIDGNFPNHHPDPTVPENLHDLVGQVRQHNADLGIAFDGDGDRLGVVSASGEIVPADRLLMLFAQDVVSRNPGCDVIFDVKCTRHLNDVIASYGGRPIMWKSGHSLIKQKMQETGALLGGEFSGHIFFKERWFGFDDGLYSAARLVEILSTTNPDLDQLLEQFPNPCGTPEIQLEVGEERKFGIVARFAEEAQFGNAKVSQIDGVRVDLPDGWGLLRASNTTPQLIMRFEAESESALSTIRQLFQTELLRLEPDLSF